MNEMARIFNTLQENYESLKNDVEKTPTRLAYAAYDFFSLEPFFQELDHIPDDKLVLYENREEVAGKDEIYLCFIDEHLIFVRIYYGQEIYYDSFFLYEKNEKRRYQVYVNDGAVKPIKVERYRFSDNQEPVSFESYSEYGYTRNEYKFENDITSVECNYYGLDEELVSKRKLVVSYDADFTAVEKIIDTTNNSNEIIYDVTFVKTDLSVLISSVQEILVKSVMEYLARQDEIDEEILCILFEYTLQGPFPPTIAFGRTSEMESTMEEYNNPLYFYNAPDMKYFSEDELKFEFPEHASAMFDELNSKLKSEKTFEELKSVVFDSYLEVCKTLKRKRSLKKLISVHKDFHVTARDFEEGNEWTYLQEVLPKKLIARYKKQIEAYEEESGLSEDDKSFMMALQANINSNQSLYPELLTILEKPDFKILYSEELLYTLKPYKYEIENHKPGPTCLFSEKEGVSEQPQGDNYFEYRINQDQIKYIGRYRNGELIAQHFYTKKHNVLSEYYFEEYEGEMTAFGYTDLITKNGQPVHYANYSPNEHAKSDYRYDGQGILTHSDEYDVIYVADTKLENKYTREYEFKNKKLSRITRNPVEEFSVVSAPIVEYCDDDSYVEEVIEDVISVHIKSVLQNLSKEILSDSFAVVLEYNSYMFFPFYHFYLLHKNNDGSIEWTRIDFASISYELEKYSNNFHLYTLYGEQPTPGEYLGKEKALIFTGKAFSDMAKKLSEAIDAEFNIKLTVLNKMSNQPKAELSEIINQIDSK